MTNKIIESIAEKIKTEFGQDYYIYSEEIKQDLKKPCFFIKSNNPYTRQGLKNRTYLVNPVVIQYFPNSINKNEEMNNVSDKLFKILKFINIDEYCIRGINMESSKSAGVLLNRLDTQYESIDGVLNFNVQYNFHIYEYEDKNYMQNLKKGVIKNGR